MDRVKENMKGAGRVSMVCTTTRPDSSVVLDPISATLGLVAPSVVAAALDVVADLALEIRD